MARTRIIRPTRLTHMEEDYLKCRSWGHEWDRFMPMNRRTALGTLLSLRCTRCRMERHDTIDVEGNVAARHYVQPPGYSMKGTKVKSAEIRLEILKRLRTHRKRRAA